VRQRVSARLRARSFGLLIAGSVLSTLLTAVGAAAEPASPVGDVRASAVEQAVRTQRPVPVEELTTETTSVVAQPDGTLVHTSHIEPVRTKKSGTWQQIDTTLEHKPDGTVGPRVTMADIALSGGGADAPMASVGHDGKEVGLSWPEALPAPVLVGDTATYPEVLPDVDLKIRVDGLGFAQVLVVKTPAAAANPKLREIAFATNTTGTRIAERERTAPSARSSSNRREPVSSTLDVVDSGGDVVFRGDASRMWDSAGGAGAGDRVAQPAEADREAVMDVQVAADTLTVAPDQAFLADPATVYPVYIDPSIGCTCGLANKVVLYKVNGAVGDTEWNDTLLKAGYVWDTSQGKWITARSYFTFNIASLPTAATIHWAKLRLTVNNAGDCDGRVNLHITNSLPAGVHFGNEPARGDRVGVVGGYQGCPGEGGWSTPGADNNRNDTLSNFLREHRADAIGNTLTFGLFGESESVQTHWRRFHTNPGLEVKYNTTPHRPGNVSAYNGTAALGCAPTAAATHIGAGTLTLRAKLTDPDSGAWTRGEFVVYRDGVHQGTLTTAQQPSGGTHQVTVPTAWRGSAGVLSWRVRTWDGTDSDALASAWTGPSAAPNDYCRFTVDTIAPDTPVVTSTDQKYLEGSSNLGTGGVGVTGRFTFAPGTPTGPGGVSDVHRYQWSIDSVAFDKSAAPGPGGSLTIAFTPMVGKVHQLNVRTVDKAGNVSSRQVVTPGKPANHESYEFQVPDGSAPVAHWPLDGDGADTGPNGHHLTLEDAATVTDVEGYTLGGLQVADHDGAAVADGPIVDTSGAFSLAGWVRLENGAGHWTRTAIALEDTYASPVMLSYRKDDRPVPHWSLGTSCHATQPCVRVAWSDAPATEGQWTHLAVTVDAATDTACLYVNGVKQTTCLTNVDLSATGTDVLMGRHRWAGQLVDNWFGRLDDVRLYDRTLAPAEVARLANVPVERARFRLADAEGTTAVEAVKGANGEVYGGSASWNAEEQAISFDGRNDVGTEQWADAQTGIRAIYSLEQGVTDSSGQMAPDLAHLNNNGTVAPTYVAGRWGSGATFASGLRGRLASYLTGMSTVQSYTASAWVKLDSKSASAAVVTKDGSQAFGFFLGYIQGEDRWSMRVSSADTMTATHTSVLSSLPARVGEWTHLAGVYDASTNTIKLFVNGVLEGEKALSTGYAWNATGPLVMGRTIWRGQQTDFLAGTVDELRVYDRAITQADAHGLWNLGSDVHAPLPAGVDSSRSFTIAGFVKLTSLDASPRAAFSLSGRRTMPVFVGYRASTGRWQVLASGGTEASQVAYELHSDQPAAAGEWVHLAVSYDAAEKKLRLYVNGQAQQWVPNGGNPAGNKFVAAPQALLPDTGRVVVGRGTWIGKNVDSWKGSIRDVRVFAGVVDDSQMAAIAAGHDGGNEET
jgi:hypothetical protein